MEFHTQSFLILNHRPPLVFFFGKGEGDYSDDDGCTDEEYYFDGKKDKSKDTDASTDDYYYAGKKDTSMDTDASAVRVKFVDTSKVTESDYDIVIAGFSDPEWKVLRAEETDSEVNDLVQNVLAYQVKREKTRLQKPTPATRGSATKAKKRGMMMMGDRK